MKLHLHFFLLYFSLPFVTSTFVNTNPEVVFIPPSEYSSSTAKPKLQYQVQQVTPSLTYKKTYNDANPNFQYQVQDIYGQYSYGYKTSNGIEKNEVRHADGTVTGSYSYVGPDGKLVSVSYRADENGFHATGDAIPKQVEPTPEVAEATRKHLMALEAARAKSGYDYEYSSPDLHDSPPERYGPVPYVDNYPEYWDNSKVDSYPANYGSGYSGYPRASYYPVNYAFTYPDYPAKYNYAYNYDP